MDCPKLLEAHFQIGNSIFHLKWWLDFIARAKACTIVSDDLRPCPLGKVGDDALPV